MKDPESNSVASRPLEASGPGDVRVGPILAIPAVLTELGVRPQRAFAQAGVNPQVFQDPESRMPFEAVGRLLETCVALTGCLHFGLLVGMRFDMKGFGTLGYLMRNSATVGEAIRSLLLHLHLHDRGAAPVLLTPDPKTFILGYSIYRHSTQTAAHAQIYDAAIAIAYRILRELCGPKWKALRVQFSHSRPSSITRYRQLFRSDVSFDAEVSGIVFAASWLDREIEGADATLHGVLAKAIRDAEASGPLTFTEQVQAVLHQMLLSGTASAKAVAQLFAVPERTLRRRLSGEGTSLQQLINQTRFDLAQQLLQNTGLPVSEIAAALQYADPNAFSRAFRNWANLSPSQWRAGR
jgi:AraC-like DNA-binding protein